MKEGARWKMQHSKAKPYCSDSCRWPPCDKCGEFKGTRGSKRNVGPLGRINWCRKWMDKRRFRVGSGGGTLPYIGAWLKEIGPVNWARLFHNLPQIHPTSASGEGFGRLGDVMFG